MEGKVITTEMEKASTWVQYFKDVLNRPEFNEIADPDPSDYLNINADQPSQVEDETATKAMKNGKLQGLIHFRQKRPFALRGRVTSFL